jgi:hypothetical protein
MDNETELLTAIKYLVQMTLLYFQMENHIRECKDINQLSTARMRFPDVYIDNGMFMDFDKNVGEIQTALLSGSRNALLNVLYDCCDKLGIETKNPTNQDDDSWDGGDAEDYQLDE